MALPATACKTLSPRSANRIRNLGAAFHDRDKFIALLKIMSEERARSGQISNPVRFSGYRLIQELGLARNGEIYEEILRWGRRTDRHDNHLRAGGVLRGQACVLGRNAACVPFVPAHGHKPPGWLGAPGAVRSSARRLVNQNLNQRYVIPEDFNAYKQLTRPTAKGVFGNLHLWFHASQGRAVEKDYAELCNLLNVKAYPHLSKIRSTMGLALDELVSIRYVQKWDICKMLSKKGFKVVLWPGDEILRILENARGERLPQTTAKSEAASPGAVAEVLEPAEAEMMDRLLRQGVLPARARSLVACYGAGRVQLVADYIEDQLTNPGHRIGNPAVLLIHSLENHLEVPAWFVARKEGRSMQKEKQKAAQQRAHSEFAYMEWLNVRRDRAFLTVYTPELLEERLRGIAAVQVKMEPKLQRWTQEARDIYARDQLWKQLRTKMNLPTFEEWMQVAEQESLFDE